MPLSIANVGDQAVFPAFFFFVIGAMAAVETQSQTTLHEDTQIACLMGGSREERKHARKEEKRQERRAEKEKRRERKRSEKRQREKEKADKKQEKKQENKHAENEKNLNKLSHNVCAFFRPQAPDKDRRSTSVSCAEGYG